MPEAIGGKGARGGDTSGIIRAMDERSRRALGTAVERHREYLGWSRPQMAREATRRFGENDGRGLSASTIKNIETRSTEVTGRVVVIIERLFGWPTGTVAGILNGIPAPDPRRMDAASETVEDEDLRALATFNSWPADVRDAALYFGALLAMHDDVDKRRRLADAAFHVLLHTPID